MAMTDAPFPDVRIPRPRLEPRRAPDRLRQLVEHLGLGERVSYAVPCRNSILVLTDRRLLDLRPKFATHGLWSVLRFEGFYVHADIPRGTVTSVTRRPLPIRPGAKAIGGETIEIVANGKTFSFLTEPYGDDLTPEDIGLFLSAFTANH